MKVALRDDDTSYFTDPDRLEAVYHDVWDRLPVALAVVPHAIGFRDKAIPEKYWQADRVFPFEENPSLVARLRRLVTDGRVTIAQHGFTHQDFPGGYEFQAAPDIEARLTKGQSYLERVLETRIRDLRAAAQRAVQARPGRGERRRAQPARVVPVVSPVDAAVGQPHARQLVAHSLAIERRPSARKAIG